MDGDDSVVTRRDLREELTTLKTELKAEREYDREVTRSEISSAMAFVVDRLGQQMERVKGELSREIAGAARAAADEHRRELGALDDRR